MKLLVLLLFVIARSAQAEEEFEVYVNTFDPEMESKMLESNHVKVTRGSGEYVSQTAQLPETEEMEKMFESADLKAELRDMPQMDRDLLYMKVQKRELASVTKSYDKIPAAKITKLKKLIEARK